MLWGGRWEGGSCLGTHVTIKDFKNKKKKNSVHTAIFKMDNPQEPTVWSGELLNVMWQPGWKEFQGEWIHVYVWLSPFAIYLKHNIVNHLYSYIKCKIKKKGVQLFVTLWTTAHQVPMSLVILQARILEWDGMPFSRDKRMYRVSIHALITVPFDMLKI